MTKCDWCNQPLADWVPLIPFDKPHHPDCHEYGKLLMEMGWTPTVGYKDTPETRKRMREQFHEEEK